MSSPILAEDFKVRTSDGRELSVSPDWRNPSGMYRVGKKKAFELYPRGLQERVLAERNKSFMKAQNEVILVEKCSIL